MMMMMITKDVMMIAVMITNNDDEDDEMFFLVRSGGFPLTCEGRWSDHIWKHTTVALNTLKHRNTRISEEQ